MNKIIINYQVNDSLNYNYNRLDNAIKLNFPNWAKPMNSVYFIKTNHTPAQVYNFLTQFFDRNDRIWCDLITSDYQGWLDTSIVNWLKS